MISTDILLQSDGQLYPPRQGKEKPPPPPKPSPPSKPVTEPPKPFLQGLPWEELLLIAVAYIVIKNSEQPDIPLLLALAYLLFDQKFSLGWSE